MDQFKLGFPGSGGLTITPPLAPAQPGGRKTCPRCGAEKPVGGFYRDRSRRSGRDCWCKKCVYEHRKRYRDTLTQPKSHKTCPACETEKPMGDFSYNRSRKDGRSCWCRECKKKDEKRYSHTPEGRINREAATRRQRKRCPQKAIAGAVLRSAVRKGRINRPSECACDCKQSGRIDGHHWDYSKPLNVRWLHYNCHMELHRWIKAFREYYLSL